MHALRVLSALVFIATVSFAQLSNASVEIGGLGAFGSSNTQNDPPTLDDNVPASGVIDFDYDASNGSLLLTVTNTSEVFAGVPNPLITKVCINLPPLAVSGVSLLGQTSSAGAMPSFSLAVDTDLQDGSNPLNMGNLGDFGVCLQIPNIQGGIGNAAADTWPGPPPALVLGPVTFSLQLTGPGIATLSAQDIANAFGAATGSNSPVNAAMKFQGGGLSDASGKISNAPGCAPGGWVLGTPTPGETVTFVQSGAPGCSGCIVWSLDPGPTVFGGVTFPIGMPAAILTSAVLPASSFATMSFPLPNDTPVGLTIYFIVVIRSSPTDPVEVSDQFSLTII